MKTKNILKSIASSFIVIAITFIIVKAGDLFPSSTTAEPSLYTLGDIYNKLTDNTSSASEGDHDLDSSATPTSTFYTLKQIYEAIPTLDARKMLTTADYMGLIGTYNATNLIPANVKNGTEFGDGETGTMSPSQPLQTGEVGDETGQARSYTDNEDGTVTDNSTGLMWKKCSEGLSGDNCQTGSVTTHIFAQAISTCENDETAGHTNWRLPNRNELLTLVDLGKFNPAIDTTIFPATVSGNYWSSTTYCVIPSGAWFVYFGDGYTYYGDKDNVYYVRCVR